MIKKSANIMLCSYPAQYPWNWWCACGHEEHGGVDVGTTMEEINRKRWEEANR
jgi:hypothetical protein